MTEFADMAYAFMTGIPGWGSRGFCMMDPQVLRAERITYARYWMRKLEEDLRRVAAAAKAK